MYDRIAQCGRRSCGVFVRYVKDGGRRSDGVVSDGDEKKSSVTVCDELTDWLSAATCAC